MALTNKEWEEIKEWAAENGWELSPEAPVNYPIWVKGHECVTGLEIKEAMAGGVLKSIKLGARPADRPN